MGFRAKGLRIGLLRLSCRAYGILGCRILGFRVEIVRAPMWYKTTIDSWCVRTLFRAALVSHGVHSGGYEQAEKPSYRWWLKPLKLLLVWTLNLGVLAYLLFTLSSQFGGILQDTNRVAFFCV